jgi:hypothetical protein
MAHNIYYVNYYKYRFFHALYSCSPVMNSLKMLSLTMFLLYFSGCSRPPLETQWQFAGVSDTGKMASDFTKILFSISPKTRTFMQETEIIDTSDSLIIPADTALTIHFSRLPWILPIKTLGKRVFTGDLGCRNRFKIRYLSGGGKIFFKEIAMTRLPCQVNKNFLFIYREYLFASNEYRVSHDTLYLKNLYSNELLFNKIRE